MTAERHCQISNLKFEINIPQSARMLVVGVPRQQNKKAALPGGLLQSS